MRVDVLNCHIRNYDVTIFVRIVAIGVFDEDSFNFVTIGGTVFDCKILNCGEVRPNIDPTIDYRATVSSKCQVTSGNLYAL